MLVINAKRRSDKLVIQEDPQASSTRWSQPNPFSPSAITLSITEILPRSKVDGLYVSITQHVTPDVITQGREYIRSERQREREREREGGRDTRMEAMR